jgi:opacity protein-like surface antigen
MKQRLVLCVAVTSLCLLPSVATVASSRPVKIGFGGGMSVPVSNAKDAFKTGFHGQAMVKWDAPKLPIGLRGTIGYERMDLKALSPGLEGNGSILSGLGNVTLGVSVGPVKPYILAGLGVYNAKADLTGATGASQTKFGIDGGAGMEFKMGAISGFIEGKLENIFTDEGFNGGLWTGGSLATRIIPVTFGVFF